MLSVTKFIIYYVRRFVISTEKYQRIQLVFFEKTPERERERERERELKRACIFLSNLSARLFLPFLLHPCTNSDRNCKVYNLQFQRLVVRRLKSNGERIVGKKRSKDGQCLISPGCIVHRGREKIEKSMFEFCRRKARRESVARSLDGWRFVSCALLGVIICKRWQKWIGELRSSRRLKNPLRAGQL